MNEHRPEVEWEKPHYYARCLYPFSCTWESKRYTNEVEAHAAADAHRTTCDLIGAGVSPQGIRTEWCDTHLWTDHDDDGRCLDCHPKRALMSTCPVCGKPGMHAGCQIRERRG